MRADLRRRPRHVPRFLLLLLSLVPVHATDLTGKITNAQGGEPLGKVRVSVGGTPLAASTAGDGTFSIPNAPAGALVLQVSAVGYRTISVPFDSPATNAAKDFAISLLPDNFQRSEKVEVHADIFQSPEWPAVGDMTLTSSELQQTSTRYSSTIRSAPCKPSRASPHRPTTIFSASFP